MAQDNERHFVSLLGVFLALISGGAAGFVLFAWDWQETTTTKNFLLSEAGLAWLIVMIASSAVMGLVILLTWKKTL